MLGVLSDYLSLRIRYKIASVPFCNLLSQFHTVCTREHFHKEISKDFPWRFAFASLCPWRSTLQSAL